MPRRTPGRVALAHWPLALLLVAIGITALAAFEAQRAVRSHRELARRTLVDYASFAAWSYHQYLRESLTAAVREVLSPVQHGHDVHRSPNIPHARDLVHYLGWDAECFCHRTRYGPTPAIYFGFTLGSDTLGIGINTSEHPERGWVVDPPPPPGGPRGAIAEYTPRERRFVNDTLTRRIREGVRSEWLFTFLVGDLDGTPRYLAYTLMPTIWGDTIVYGVEYAHDDMRALLEDLLASKPLLPPTLTGDRANADMIAIEVVRRGGAPTLFASGTSSRWENDASYTVPASFGSMIVHAQIRPELAGVLVIGGLPRSRLPFLLGTLLLAAALAVVAVRQLRREGELARMRSDFVASVSHELRTPLAQMRLYLETLRLGRYSTAEQRQRSLDHVEREVRRLSNLAESVLRFARGPAGDEPCVPVRVAQEVEDVTGEFIPLAESRRATIAVSVDPEAAGLVADLRPGTLRQVLVNLLDNAVKYGPTGQTIVVRVSPGDEGTVRLSVDDEGPGVAIPERQAVWASFRRGAAARASGAGGSGIGLTVVRELVTAHGGRAWIDSAAGGGASFRVELPVAAGSASAQSLQQLTVRPPSSRAALA